MADFPVTLDVEVEEEISEGEAPKTITRGGINPYDQGTLSSDERGYKPLVVKKTKRVLTQKRTEELKASLADIRGGLSDMFDEIGSVGEFQLNEIKVVLEVTAEGGFALVGSAKAGVKGGVTLTFSPPK